MADHALREELTIHMVNDALEANGQDMDAAAMHLLDAVGTLIVRAHLQGRVDGRELARRVADDFVEQVVSHLDVWE